LRVTGGEREAKVRKEEGKILELPPDPRDPELGRSRAIEKRRGFLDAFPQKGDLRKVLEGKGDVGKGKKNKMHSRVIGEKGGLLSNNARRKRCGAMNQWGCAPALARRKRVQTKEPQEGGNERSSVGKYEMFAGYIPTS